MSDSMRAVPRRGGGWTVGGGGRPKKGWSQPLVDCVQRGEAFSRGGLEGLDEETMREETRDLDYFGVDEIGLKPLAGRAGLYGRVYGSGIKDGRGYGPYGAGYYDEGKKTLPYGPNGERLSAVYDFQGEALHWRAPKKVLPGFTADTVIGAEWMDLAKAGTGLLSGFGNMFSSGGGAGGGGAGGGSQTPQAAAEKQRLEDEKKRAEESARNLKIGLGIGGGVLAAVGITLLAVKK